MRKHDGKAKEAAQQAQEDDWLKHCRKWFKDLVALANEARRMADVVDCTPEQLEKLLEALDPHSLMYIHGGGRALFNLANQLAELLGEDGEVRIADSSRTSRHVRKDEPTFSRP